MVSAGLLYNNARDFFGNRDVLYVDEQAIDRVRDYAVVRYKRFGGSVGAGFDLSTTTQAFFDYRLERIDVHAVVGVGLEIPHRRSPSYGCPPSTRRTVPVVQLDTSLAK